MTTHPRADVDLARLWRLDPDLVFLNHGSFGACPAAVLEVQSRLRARLERDPVRFMALEFEGLIDAARAELATFVGAEAEDLAFVPNTTTAVSAVLRSLDWKAGDEVVILDHAYNAVRAAVDVIAGGEGARVVTAQVSFPGTTPDAAVDAVLARITDRTRLAILDHVTSPTALVLPIERLVRELRARGVDTFVDGAHAPGMVPLSIAALDAAYYAGNCHKWLCAPKGAGFLWVERSRQARIRPLAISHGANSARTDRSRFQLEFDWTGTGDPTPYLCVPEAIRFLGSVLDGGWPVVMARNRALALEGRALVCAELGVPIPCSDDMIGSMASIPLPQAVGPHSVHPWGWDPLQEALRVEHHIDAIVNNWSGWPRRWLRISAQLYNHPSDYQRVADALVQLLRRA